MGCCTSKPIKKQITTILYDKNTIINPLYFDNEEEEKLTQQPVKPNLHRKTKDEYMNEAKDLLKDLDHFLHSC